MKKIYISGKITGLEISEARKHFDNAEEKLRQDGYKPINPMREVPYNAAFDWKDYMLADIELLFDCQAIYMLSNWGSSKGARIELVIAIEHGMEIIYEAN